MLIGLIGKPSSGKTTLFNSMCLTDAKMGDYPFTTINPNKGMAHVRVQCPCINLPEDCEPNFGKCVNGTRYVPIEVIDVAGLVPGASTGKGMGNKFLDDLRQANMLIHVLDSSGTTDAEGNETDAYSPTEDILWLDDELIAWVRRIVFKDWDRFSKKLDADRSRLAAFINEKLSGLGSQRSIISGILRETGLTDKNPREWSDEDKQDFAKMFKSQVFPILIAANKIDRPTSEANLAAIKSGTEDNVMTTSGLCELFLRKATQSGLIKYAPGSRDFEILSKDQTIQELKPVLAIKEKLLDLGKSTGVIELLEYAVFEALSMRAVFPVEDQNRLTDKDGKLLPDVHLVRSGTNARELAGLIHSDFREGFLHALLVNESNKRISANYELNMGDIVKIVSTK